MKNILLLFSSIIFLSGLFNSEKVNSQICCPDFILKDAVEICAPHMSCSSDQPGIGFPVAACKNSVHTYTVYPNDLSSFTYTWTVTGGTPSSTNGNPVNILWGNGATGYIKVVITSNNPNFICTDSIMQQICLIDGPQAAFTVNYDSVCTGVAISLTNTSLGGSAFTWNMGDGTIYTSPTPPNHTYQSPGTYTIILTVKDMGQGQYVGGPNGENRIPCGCADTASAVVVVLPGAGPEIVTDCCYGTVCPGDTSEFCTPMVCGTYNWSVAGGTIVTGAGTSCIKVKWDNTYSVPTTVTLQSCPSSSCPGSTTINVPVLYPNLPISGPTNLCLGASGTFSLPHLPGTFYKWTVTGGPYIFNEKNRNVSLVNISFNSFGNYWVKCEYNNPLAGCDGVDSLLVTVTPKFDIVGPEKICEGDTVFYFTNSLVGGPPANWTFSPAGPVVYTGQGTPNPSIIASPGNYTIIATSLTPPVNCNLVATKNIQVVAKPILGNITGATMACPNTNYTYGITSNTSGSSFIWSVGPGSGAIFSQMGDDNDSVIVQFSGSGPWTLNVYQEIDLGNNDFCKSLTKTLVVNPFPAPNITGAHTVCVDAVENYTASGPVPPGGFLWSISPSAQGTILNGQGSSSVNIKWHGPAATNVVLTVTTCSGQDTIHVDISTPPTVLATPSQPPLFCLGDNQVLTISTPFVGTYNYQWYDNNGILTGETNSSISLNIASFTNPGTYSYYVVVTNGGCTRTSNIVNVIISTCTGGGGPSGCPPNPVPDCPTVCFNTNVLCGQVQLFNSSYVVPNASIQSYTWSVSPNTGTFTPSNTAPNPTLTVPTSGTYTITLTVISTTNCTASASQAVTVFVPTASFTVSSPVCENSFATFTASPILPGLNYFWTFGDGSTSYSAITQHSYASAALSPYTVSLTISDNNGCVANYSAPVTVNPNPVCTISSLDTAFCPGGFVPLTACSGMSSYQWYLNGSPISNATGQTHNANQVGEYYCDVTNSAGCSGISNKLFIYMHKRPKADITGDGYYCSLPGGTIYFSLSTIYNANYSYSWTCIPGGATFSPSNSANTWVSLTVPLTLPAYFQFVVDVTDNITQCVNSDTLCVTVYETPSLSILSIPALDVCEGTPVTLIPNLNNTGLYSYQWSNGATTPVITVSSAGFYSLTITNKATGCSATANAGAIHPKPDLSLFPIGCDELCDPDSLHLYIPLPLNALPPFNTYAAAYPIITWLDYGSPVGSGPTLAFPAGTSGNHQFSVAVMNQFGCVDTAGVFCLTNGCCNIDLEYLEPTSASCATSADGSFTIVLDPASTGGPFTITSIPLMPPLPTTIIPGNPLTVSNLPPGTYTIIINGPTEGCTETFFVDIGYIEEECCFAEIDSTFTKILVNTTYTTDVVWDGKYFIDDNVIVTVTNGAVLDITNVDCVFGECAGIVFTNGAMLRSTNSVYRPCFVDDTWKGLRFTSKGEFDNIINECTFKNAEVALYFQGNADGVISSNLFSNCNYGIRVEGNNNFNHPVTGNHFVTEQFFPNYDCPTKYSFINNSSSYGIYTTTSRFKQQVSQNEFVNTWGNDNPRTHGIYQVNGGATISYNTFTDLSYSIYLSTALFTTIIENNEIEINEVVNTTVAPIYVNTTTSPLVEINNNEISDNYHQFNCFSAIYLKSSANVSVINNRIDGFQYGIYANSIRNTQISNNEIIDSDVIGIYFSTKGIFKNYITCNNIKMRSFTNTRGIYTVDMTTRSEISSNCINDCYVSMDIRSFTGAVLPKIRNNFLYNYNFVGINAVGHTGNIGTLSPADPGLNTLWSNYNPAIDINSNTNITVADNFGMFNISWPTVQITSNRPFHSTASCAQQIFNMPSQGNLNINYTCDNFKNLFTAFTGVSAPFALAPDYREQLQVSEYPYEEADLLLAAVEPTDPALVDELIQLPALSDNEKSLLQYNYAYRNADFAVAGTHLASYSPTDEEGTDFKILALYDLDIIMYGRDILTGADLEIIRAIAEKLSVNSNFAITLLNNSPEYRDHLFEPVPLPEVLAGADIKRIGEEAMHLVIRPNPASDRVFIESVFSPLSEVRVEMHDVSGKLITGYSLQRAAGGIELDISRLREGFYFVVLTDPATGTVKTGKLIKVKSPGN